MKELDLFDDLTPEADRPQRDVSHAAWHDHDALLALLQRWVDRGWLRPLDRALVVFLHREVGDGQPLLLLAAALASHQLGRGHVCLDLAQTLAAPNLALSLPPEGDDLNDPPPLPSEILDGLHLDTWRAALANPMLVSHGDQARSGNTPLVRLDTSGSTRLYLRRYWQYEQDIRHALHGRLTHELPTPPTETLKQALDALFGEATASAAQDDAQLDWQKLACALAARSRFSVITGGPGTGKTTTVVRLLALLQALQLGQTGDRPLRIRLAAPTGKAAARLNESIAKQVEGISLLELASAACADGVDIQTLREAIPTEVTTLHRLLGSRPDTRHFRYNPSNRLALDVLVVDEASMVDIEMMAALLGALPPRARLVLLGDKDQLASVEAGAVLGDLCQRAEGAHYTPSTCDWLAQVAGATLPERYQSHHGQALDQAIAMLRVSHRFDASSGIGQLAQAVNRPLASDHQPKDKRRAV
ncbi:exodeoxyribonuclease V subunit alpha, partial [Halomonas sp. BBD48]|nr:exodeoxyribonuclease V subunit alpha [Halomonas sp. BBD48]